MRKILTRLRGTNFCTSSTRFAPSFVRQQNGLECTQIVRNATKRQFRVRWGVSGAFVAKNSDATSWHELLHKFGRFAPSYVRQPNGPESTQKVRNAPKYEFRVQWGGSAALRKIPTRLRSMNFCTSSACFASSFVRQQNSPECTQIVRNAPEREFWFNEVDQVRSLRKIPTRLRGTNFCTGSARCAPSFVRQPKDPESTQIV